jgi:hypothetical protein
MHRNLFFVFSLLCSMLGCVDDESGTMEPFFVPGSAGESGGSVTPGSGGSESQNMGGSAENNGGSAGGDDNPPAGGSAAQGGSPGVGMTTPSAGSLGAPCSGDSECDGGICLDGMPGGYCSNNCTAHTECDGGLCFSLQGIDNDVCLLECASNRECRVADGYGCDSDNTCFPDGSGGGTGGSTGSMGGGASSIGGPCTAASDCADAGAQCIPGGAEPGDFIDGFCYLPGCSESTACPSGSTCFTLEDESTACLPDCNTSDDCRSGYACITQGTCMPGCTADSCPDDLICNDEGLCEEPPCTASSCASGLVCGDAGRCVLEVGAPPSGPVPDCSDVASWQCTGPDCSRLIQIDPRVGRGYSDYGLNGETLSDQYRSFARGDLLALVSHAADMVACLSQNWTVGLPGPLGLGDMSEANGSIPGSRDNDPGHPAGTHVDGFDMDIAYYMLIQPQSCSRSDWNPGCDDCHCLSPVCEYRLNGEDQYHCVEEPSILDVWRTALFLGYLHASPQLRVIGVDGKIGLLAEAALTELCAGGWIDNSACNRTQITYEVTDTGRGWYRFHHHHLHVSITGPGSRLSLPADQLCLTDGCVPMSLPHHDPRASWVGHDLPAPLQSLPLDEHAH